MEIQEIILIVLIILGALISMIVSIPMKKHLLAETKIKSIGLLQMPFYLKDYHKMINESSDIPKKKRYQTYFTVFMISNIGFVLSAIILLIIPGSPL